MECQQARGWSGWTRLALGIQLLPMCPSLCRSALVTGRGSSLASTRLPCPPFCWPRGTLFTTPDEPGKPIRKQTYLGPHAKPSQQEAIFSRCGPSLCLTGPPREPWVTSRQIAWTWISPLPEADTPVTAVGVSLAGRHAGSHPAILQLGPHGQPVSVWLLAGALEPRSLNRSIECYGKMDGN